MKHLFQNKLFRITLFTIIFIFLSIQFIKPKLEISNQSNDLSLNPAVKKIFKRTCYDCHSNETNLSWFDKIQPAYWLVAQHVKTGRQYLNFSRWDSMPMTIQKGVLFESLNQIQFGTMPLDSYEKIHPGSKVSSSEVSEIEKYLSTLITNNPSDSSVINSANRQYNDWLQHQALNFATAPSPNGIEFIPAYKNWKAISSTDRLDNGTMRIVFGNDIAVKAISNKNINPWPDGTIFAKAAWAQVRDSLGNVHTGQFIQVEFMIKDARKYASTNGWGFARWKGVSLMPYGKNKLFTTECMGCHQPMKNNDFVFTMPLTF